MAVSRDLAGGVLLLLAVASAAAEEQGAPFTLSNGRSIVLTPVESMSCEGLRAKLDEIDATGYRGARPAPASRADDRLLDYETAVSMRYYNGCVEIGGSRFAPSAVFRGGFD